MLSCPQAQFVELFLQDRIGFTGSGVPEPQSVAVLPCVRGRQWDRGGGTRASCAAEPAAQMNPKPHHPAQDTAAGMGWGSSGGTNGHISLCEAWQCHPAESWSISGLRLFVWELVLLPECLFYGRCSDQLFSVEYLCKQIIAVTKD